MSNKFKYYHHSNIYLIISKSRRLYYFESQFFGEIV